MKPRRWCSAWREIAVFCMLAVMVRGLTTTRITSSSTSSFAVSRTTSKSNRRTSQHHQPHPLAARPWAEAGDDGSGGAAREYDRSTDRPTQTRTDPIGPDLLPSKPKIVILGASGKVGRLVVRQLLEAGSASLGDGAIIVAVVRDYDKACRVLYDDLLVTTSGRNKKGAATLQIVQADLVPRQELPGYREEDEEEDEEWLSRASSAASFYGNSVEDYDDGKANAPDSDIEGLQDAIRDCTTIISCVGSVRPTNLWTDFLARPLWRILLRDVRGWCSDARHPYYVNYASTRKALGLAEKEQVRREAAMEMDAEEEEHNNSKDNKKKNPPIVPRIRFIRISDLCVAQQPWHFVPLLTNIMHSMVFRYQDMTEQLLESTTLIDTVILRPGDLCDEDRNVNTTSLQVDPAGSVPSPSRVGREDVASLVVASTLFSNHWASRKRRLRTLPKLPMSNSDSSAPSSSKPDAAAKNGGGVADSSPPPVPTEEDDDDVVPERKQRREPFHYTLGVRWAGAQLDPYPAQGHKSDGFPSAQLALRSALRKLRQKERQRHSDADNESAEDVLLPIARHRPRRRIKPYGITVAVPVYLTLFWLTRATVRALFPLLPARGQQAILPVAQVFQNALAVVTLVVGRLAVALKQQLNSMTGRAARQYISF